MKKYIFSNKKLIFMYLMISVVVYISVTRIYGLYSIITDIVNTMDSSRVLEVIIYCAGVLAILLITLILSSILKRNILQNISYEIRKDIMRKVYKMDIKSYYTKNSSYYTSMLVNDVNMLEENYFSNVFELVSDIIQLLIMIFAIAVVGLPYLLIVIIAAIPSAIQPLILKKKLGKKGEKVSDEMKNYTNKTKEFFLSYEVIHAFRRVSIFNQIFRITTFELEKSKYNLELIKTFNTGLMLVAVYSLKIGTQLYFANSAINGLITVATVTLLFGLANNVGNPITSILTYLQHINSTKEIQKKVNKFINDNTTLERLEGSELNENIKNICLKDVTFSYDNENKILDNLNVKFEKGKKYALVGESGSGKSTILKLIMGYYENFTGSYSMNGVETKDLSKKCIRNKIVYLTQNSVLLDGTFKENITLFRDNYLDSEIERVINDAALDDLYSGFKNGLDEIVSGGNVNVSGGERQRIAIARAMLSKAEVLLMDEGVSALDNITAMEVEKVLLKDEKQMLISVIHRINESIELYDCILYLENGKVIESGNYNELMKKNDKFSKLVEGQGGIRHEELSAKDNVSFIS
ncbi:ABC transporter ATP-binding protein [Clostridium tunisiense]|uniref:ABC transporter ATP-binding protein n=1 Tax=Clostridium tunisiense TaxID=219748 RepID=UPI00031B0BCB|nr:ABC transporter ATP-binding protein [Clostridium tunisiense]